MCCTQGCHSLGHKRVANSCQRVHTHCACSPLYLHHNPWACMQHKRHPQAGALSGPQNCSSTLCSKSFEQPTHSAIASGTAALGPCPHSLLLATDIGTSLVPHTTLVKEEASPFPSVTSRLYPHPPLFWPPRAAAVNPTPHAPPTRTSHVASPVRIRSPSAFAASSNSRLMSTCRTTRYAPAAKKPSSAVK